MALRGRLPQPPKSVFNAGAQQHYEHPLYYDRAYRSRSADVAYYVGLAKRSGGEVLEYGVGSGRVALAIAAEGVGVVGVDQSSTMLKRFREKQHSLPELAGRVRVIKGDMRSRRLGQRFGLIIAPFNTVLHLYTRRDVERFFARVREHLRPGGRFVFDFSVPRAAYLGADPNRWYGGGRVKHPDLGATVRYKERFHYSPLTQVLSTWMRFEGDTPKHSAEVLLTHRQFFPQEMALLLSQGRFRDCRWSADFTGAAPSAQTDSLVVNCAADPDADDLD